VIRFRCVSQRIEKFGGSHEEKCEDLTVNIVFRHALSL
jgi:hypothetical protein